LGIDYDVRSQTHEVELAPKTWILFYTDGLVEFDRHSDRAEETARDALARMTATATSNDAAAEITRAVIGKARPSDDVAVVVVHLE
jgi:serine/threonine protein phosphatase PrpC